jgi:hypothetical protein
VSAFPDWEQYAIPQRRIHTGCIPTGYEMILRAAGVKGINYNTFQDDFDLEARGISTNSFGSVAKAVKDRYDHVNFKDKRFDKGIEKLRFIEDRIKRKQPILVSVVLLPFTGKKKCHIAPVVNATVDELILLWTMRADRSKEIRKLCKSLLVRIHDKYEKGRDVAYLDNQ